ncbi:MAG: B3/B4 domain-containing protein [Candidatus Freyarchaeota archaeon]
MVAVRFIEVEWDRRVATSHPELVIVAARFVDVHAEVNFEVVERLEASAFQEIRSKYTLEGLKNDPAVRAYRDFYWRLSIDPTKQRPAAEALIRRVLNGRKPWRINTFVNSYNLASALTGVTLGAYDLDRVKGEIRIRFASPGEPFQGIGMHEPKPLTGKEIVVTDDEGVIAIYPYRDAERTKVTGSSRTVLLIAYGVPKLPKEKLEEAVKLTDEIVKKASAGRLESYFTSRP